MIKPLITVIIPVYKVEPYLPYCVESVRKQTYENLEIILVDDGSPDNCPVICDRFAMEDSRIRVIHQKNGGLSAARNSGLDVMTGDYVLLVDSDDVISPDTCERMLHAALENDAQMVRCSYYRFNDHENIPDVSDGNTYEVFPYTTEEAVTDFVCTPYSEKKRFTTMACAALYLAELFLEIRFPAGLLYEDGYTFPRLLMQCKKLVYIDARLYGYYYNDNGIMASGFTAKALLSLDDWKELHEQIAPAYPALRVHTANRWIGKYLRTYVALQERTDLDPNDRYKNKIRQTLKEAMPEFETYLPKSSLKMLTAFIQGDAAYEKYQQKKALQDKIKGKLRKILK